MNTGPAELSRRQTDVVHYQQRNGGAFGSLVLVKEQEIWSARSKPPSASNAGMDAPMGSTRPNAGDPASASSAGRGYLVGSPPASGDETGVCSPASMW